MRVDWDRNNVLLEVCSIASPYHDHPPLWLLQDLPPHPTAPNGPAHPPPAQASTHREPQMCAIQHVLLIASLASRRRLVECHLTPIYQTTKSRQAQILATTILSTTIRIQEPQMIDLLLPLSTLLLLKTFHLIGHRELTVSPYLLNTKRRQSLGYSILGDVPESPPLHPIVSAPDLVSTISPETENEPSLFPMTPDRSVHRPGRPSPRKDRGGGIQLPYRIFSRSDSLSIRLSSWMKTNHPN
jgi:hypothetical protein